VGILKLPKLGFPQLWGPITLYENLWFRWGLEQSYSLCQELSNGISHATFMQGNWDNSRFLVIGSRIANLTPGPSFGHNVFQMSKWVMQTHFKHLCFNSFQMVWKTLRAIGFWPLQSLSEHSGVHWDFNSRSERSFGSVRVHSLTLSFTPGFPLGPQPCKPLPWSWAHG
jgi:hypothetical protein